MEGCKTGQDVMYERINIFKNVHKVIFNSMLKILFMFIYLGKAVCQSS